MGSNSSSGGGGGNNNTYKTSREIGITTQYSKTRKQDIKKEKKKAFQEQGAYNTRRSLENTPSLITKILKPAISEPLQKNAIRNRDFFTNKVLGKGAYKGTTKQDFEKMSRTSQENLYSNYTSGRQSGQKDAYGRDINQTDRGGNSGGAIGTSGQVVQAPTVTAPTTAEVSQSAATDAAEDNILLRKKRTKARGRSTTIVTGSTGATGSLTLGIPSLLGR
jgi:hypothetical protein